MEEKPPKAVVGVVVVRYLTALFTENESDVDIQVMRNLTSRIA